MGINCHLIAIDGQSADEIARNPRKGVANLARIRRAGCDVHKAWHAIHFVLTGTSDGGDEPNCFLLQGGVTIGPPVEYEDSPRLLTPDQVRAFDAVLQPIAGLEEIRERFDHEAMVEQGVYSMNEGEDEADEDLEFTADFFEAMRKFIHESAQTGRGVIIDIG